MQGRSGLDAAGFEAIRAAEQPVVLRVLGSAWPAVQAAKKSDEALLDYLRRFVHDRPVGAIVGDPDIEGRFFYTDDLRELNFKRGKSPLQPFLDRLVRDRAHPRPIAMAVQSEQIPQLLPGFEIENRVDLLPGVVPRAWIGNRIQVAAHYDLMENIGIVVAGRRRFTLFPPEQLVNLYPGPLELTPAGTPVSLVDIRDPDFERFPRFKEAAKTAQQATLEPGDAIYIPYHWWHAVDSLEPVNLFVNYWWNDASTKRGNPLEASKEAGSPYDALMHAFFALRPLPDNQKRVWRHVFDYYVFGGGPDPAEHLPDHAKGVLGPPTAERMKMMRATLKMILDKM
jgi:hypothetical protein